MAEDASGNSAQMYFSGSMGVFFSRLVGMVAGVASLWFLTRVLSTEAFASYTFAMSLVYVLGFVAGLGLERVMLLKLSPLKPVRGVLNGGRLVRRIAVQVAVSSCLVAALALGVLKAVPALSANNDLVGWFAALMPIVPAVALTAVLVAWLQSNHVVGRPQAIHGQVDGLRCLGFAVVFAIGLGGWAVAAAAVAASILPPILLASKLGRGSRPEPSAFELRDVLAGLNFFVMRLAQIGFMHADILIMGVLAPPPAVAAYVVASRFALILEAGQQIFAPAYTPRVRRHIEDGTVELAAREYHVARTLGFLAATVAAMGFMLIGQWLLGVFGDFEEAYGVLLWMCAGQLLLVGAGMHSVHLSMSRHLSVAMGTQLAGIFVFLMLLLVLVPEHGAKGAAASFLLAQLVLAVVGLGMMVRYADIWPFRVMSLLGYVLAAGALVLVGYAPGFVWLGVVVLLLSLVLTGLSEPGLVRSVMRDCFAQIGQLRSRL